MTTIYDDRSQQPFVTSIYDDRLRRPTTTTVYNGRSRWIDEHWQKPAEEEISYLEKNKYDRQKIRSGPGSEERVSRPVGRVSKLLVVTSGHFTTLNE